MDWTFPGEWPAPESLIGLRVLGRCVLTELLAPATTSGRATPSLTHLLASENASRSLRGQLFRAPARQEHSMRASFASNLSLVGAVGRFRVSPDTGMCQSHALACRPTRIRRVRVLQLCQALRRLPSSRRRGLRSLMKYIHHNFM